MDAASRTLQLHLQVDWPKAGLGRLRIFPITLFAETFASASLSVQDTNGGAHPEHFPLAPQPVDHGKAVSFLVSAHLSLGLTDGTVSLGEASKALKLRFNPADAAVLGQIVHQPVDETWFARLTLSARELDGTAKQPEVRLNLKFEITTN